ncbi:hypothetical protein [Breoghania sp.]|uniref:hypothetical protein n=1 Tax=Breoghania sp. TaxID=2065378 RepID=UPI00263145FB|nr:hypothetical protein [Breoghania sp.]MDJ0932985.1 hypothetical protein [Breoghania sp.]
MNLSAGLYLSAEKTSDDRDHACRQKAFKFPDTDRDSIHTSRRQHGTLIEPRLAFPDKTDCCQFRRLGAMDALRAIIDEDRLRRFHIEGSQTMERQIGHRFGVLHHIRAEDMRRERVPQIENAETVFQPLTR